MSTVSINHAAQVLRPPSDGLEYVSLVAAAESVTEPGSVFLDGSVVGGFERARDAAVQVDARGCAVIPGFVDAHTHVPFAGWRAEEYVMRLAGASYEEIARAGGGIRASARALAAAPDEDVVGQARALASEMLAHGTTAFEGKSGYGLSVDGELRALRLAASLDSAVLQLTRSTALLAHAVPEGFDAGAWMGTVEEMMPSVMNVGNVTALDIYVESGVAFGNMDLARMGALAREYGLDLRAHVEQFSRGDSVPVALSAGARSVDHLACLPDEHVELLANARTAAVLLPGAEFLGDERVAPARSLADAGAICVLATDLNPGTSPVASLPVIIGIACRRYRWSVREALLACTLNAAWVLRLSDRIGSLELGKRADVVVLDGPVEQIPYRFGRNPVALVFVAGALVHVRPDCAWRVGR